GCAWTLRWRARSGRCCLQRSSCSCSFSHPCEAREESGPYAARAFRRVDLNKGFGEAEDNDPAARGDLQRVASVEDVILDIPVAGEPDTPARDPNRHAAPSGEAERLVARDLLSHVHG